MSHNRYVLMTVVTTAKMTVERAEVMMQNKKRRTRRSHGDDDKDSPEAIVK